MATTKKTAKKGLKKPSKTSDKKSRMSKTWAAALKNVGTGRILDMRAVLK